jgi:hypothetical protein
VVGRRVSVQADGRFTCKRGVLVSGGTRIRSGDTMIFRSVPNPAVRRHRLHLSGFWRSPTPDYSRSRVSLMNRGNAIASGWDRCARCKRSFWRTHRSLCASEPKPPRSFMNNPGYLREPLLNARNRHAVVVALWWALRISDHLRHTLCAVLPPWLFSTRLRVVPVLIL